MPQSIDADDTPFRLLVNDEEQYGLWPADQPLPGGWRDTGIGGDRAACLAALDAQWTDMRPRSLRRAAAG